MTNFWDLYAMVYDSLPRHFLPYQELIEEIANEISTCSTNKKILDAGCGTGNFSMALAKMGKDVTGIDYSDSMLKRAEKKKKQANDCRIQFKKLDLGNGLPYPDNSFDAIISVHTLYTIKETNLVLKEYYRTLGPNGYFILSELQRPIAILPTLREEKHRNGLFAAVRLFYHLFILGAFNLIIAERQSVGYYHYWSENELRNMLLEAGFQIINVKETYTNNIDLLIVTTKIPKDNESDITSKS